MQLRVLLLAGLLLPTIACAEPYPKPQSDAVSDFADLLPATTESRLTDRLRAIRQETGVHLVIVTLPRRAGNGPQGSNLESYATGLFNAWGVGDASRNDGVMILVLPEDREMRLELGAGYPGAYDATARSVVAESFLPEFRQGRYANGIETGTEATIARIIRPFASKAPLGTKNPPFSPVDFLTQAAIWLVAGLAGLVVLLGLLGKILSDAFVGFQRCRVCGQRALERSRVTLVAASEGGEGREEVTTRCTACGHSETYTVVISKERQNRSGGGGFGGGRSSGGGASGRW